MWEENRHRTRPHVEQGELAHGLAHRTRRLVTVKRLRGDGAMKVLWTSYAHQGHRFWTGRYGVYTCRIDAKRPGVYLWLVTKDTQRVREGTVPDRPTADQAVDQALRDLGW